MNIDTNVLLQLISSILGLLSIFLGSKWAKAKAELTEMSKLTTKLAAALKATSDAIQDDRITPEEEKVIVESWQYVIEEAKKLLGKS